MTKQSEGVWEMRLPESPNYCLHQEKYFNAGHFVAYSNEIKAVISCCFHLKDEIKSVFTEEWLPETVYAFTTPKHFLLLKWCTVSFKKRHPSALPFLSPSSRAPAGASAARQKWESNMKIYKCEFHEARCSYHAIHSWPLRHCMYLASTQHAAHLIPVAITARVQL